MAEQTVIGKVGLTPKGEYNPETVYEILDVVSNNGNSYVSRIAENNQALSNTEAWMLSAEKGGKGDQGNTFTFDDLTDDEKEQLKGDVIAYNSLTDVDKNDLASRVPANGAVINGDTKAVSGNEVFKGISNALDLSEEFKIKQVVPEDRSLMGISAYYGTMAYYYEGLNHFGAKKVNVFSTGTGAAKLAILQIAGNAGALIQAVDINLITGVNEFAVSELGFIEANLQLENFVFGISPVAGSFLPFEYSSEGSLSVMAKGTGSITVTPHKGCVWVDVDKTPYLIRDYPNFKDLFSRTINKENSFKDLIVPYAKENIIYSIDGAAGVLYGAADTFYSLQNGLKNLKIKSVASGFVNIYFVNIEGSALTILHTTQVSCSVGDNTFTAQVLNAPVPVNDKKIYILTGNETNKTPNVVQGVGGDSPISRLYFTYQTSNQQLTQTEGNVGFNFWLTVYELENKLVAEVDRLTQIVENLPTPTDEASLYDYKTNAPILPCDIFIDEAKPTPIFKNSLFQKYIGQVLPNVKLISNRKTFDIQDPTYINYDDVGNLARLLVEKHTESNTIVYKDVNVYKYNSAIKSGAIKIWFVADSLGEGGINFATSPLYILTEKFHSMGITVEGIGTIQRTSGTITQKYNGQGGWRYRTFVGLESQFAGYNVTIPNQTKSTWVEGVDGDMLTIKSNNFFLYPATAQDKIDYPQWCFHFVTGASSNNVSYAQNPTLGTYYIFDPSRYLSERNIEIPDVVSLALGTNEWYLDGFSGWNLPLITSCADWMIQRFLDAVPSTTAVLVTTCNNMPLTRENEWQEKASLLTSAILKIIETKKATHSNLYGLSIYAHGSRQMAFNQELSSANLSENNTTKVAVVDADVHVLNIDDEGRSDYIEALKTAVLYFV